MNERIREFARQSHLDVYGLGKDREKWEFTLEKFAELIVKECMDLVASRPYIDDGNWSHPSMMIKQHFGVEQ